MDRKTDPAVAQLPAYSETDEHSNTEFEMVDAPQPASEPSFMTAEQEKAYLADQDQQEARKDLQVDTIKGLRECQGDRPSIPALSRGLLVPSCRGKVSSGFPYPDVLNGYGTSPQEWSTFTSEITQAARLTSKDWTITVGAGAAAFLTSGIFIGWLGLIPAFVVGHHLRRSTEHKNLRATRDSGNLESKLLRWNESSFAPKGFLVRLDLPGDELSDLDHMDVYTPKKQSWNCGGGRMRARGAEKRAQCSKRKISKRGRIVIVPLNGVSGSKNEDFIDHNQLPASEKGLTAMRAV